LIVAAGCAAAFLGVIRPFEASCSCQEGESLLQSDLRSALVCQERAVCLDPGTDILWIKLAGALAGTPKTGDAQQRKELLLRARQAAERACELVPANGENHANRARILSTLREEGLARPEEVLAAFDEALLRDPFNTIYLTDAARSAVGGRLVARAHDYLKRCRRLDDNLGML